MQFTEKSCDKYIVFGLIIISLCLPEECYGYKMGNQQQNLENGNTNMQIRSQKFNNALLNGNKMFRMKREVESMDYMDVPAGDMQEDEDGFWSRVLRAALKVLKSVMSWLNT